jgi:hypothetical protein
MILTGHMIKVWDCVRHCDKLALDTSGDYELSRHGDTLATRQEWSGAQQPVNSNFPAHSNRFCRTSRQSCRDGEARVDRRRSQVRQRRSWYDPCNSTDTGETNGTDLLLIAHAKIIVRRCRRYPRACVPHTTLTRGHGNLRCRATESRWLLHAPCNFVVRCGAGGRPLFDHMTCAVHRRDAALPSSKSSFPKI